MKTKTKKLLSILMGFALILSTLTFVGVSAGAETSGNFKYSVLYDDIVQITGYNGSATELEIPSIIDGITVTSIGEYAFQDCSSLTSILIPDSVTSIGYGAFYNCESLTSVTVPDSVIYIGNHALGYVYDYDNDDYATVENFTINGYTNSESEKYAKSNGFNLNSLGTVSPWKYDIYDKYDNTISITKYTGSETEIEIPSEIDSKKVVYISENAFKNCKSLTSVTIPNSVTSIGYEAFYNCESLTSVIIPNSVISIGYEAFKHCTELTSIIIPDSVTSIGNEAFYNTGYYNNTGNWENNVLYIGKYLISASYYCYDEDTEKGISFEVSGDYIIKDSTKLIAEDAFVYCMSLTSVTIPDSVTSIGDGAFVYCRSLTCVKIGNNVTTVGNNAFQDCSSLTSILIPDSVTSIGNDAFRGCSSLISINVDKNNKNYSDIDEVLFNNDKTTILKYPSGRNDTSYTIPYSITSIGDCAFEYCTSLKSIILPDSVTNLGSRAFEFCDSLTNITIPDSVANINSCAFLGCTSLTSITIPDSVTSISDSTFSGCTALTSITIGDSVTSISDSAFEDCIALTSITIPDSVTSIGCLAFYYCKALINITIPDSVTSIGDYAFFNTAYYNNEDNWENNVLYIGNYLIDANTSISGDYIIKDETKAIADYAFYKCESLTSVAIPNSVTNIGYEAFYKCTSLTSVTIPDCVTDIGDYAFEYCESLTSVTIPDSVTDIGFWAFRGCKSDLIIYGYSNTEAERYANENRITFVALDTPITPDTPQHTHSYTSKITKQPTCTAKGVRTYTCSCGDSYTEPVQTKSHSYKWITTKKANYVSTGTKSYKCTVCGKVTKTSTIDKFKLKTPSFSVSGGKKLFKVKYTKVTGATEFQVKYTIGKKTVTKTFSTKKSITKTISGLKKGSYKVRIRALIKQSGKTAYSNWTKIKTVKVK